MRMGCALAVLATAVRLGDVTVLAAALRGRLLDSCVLCYRAIIAGLTEVASGG